MANFGLRGTLKTVRMNLLENLSARLPFGNKIKESEYFFALVIGVTQLTGAVWEMRGREIDILGSATLPYSGNDDLVDKAFQAIDKAVGDLEIEPKKILFGVPDSWGMDDNLKEPYLKLLGKIVKEADLEPMAYVTVTNAISYFLQKADGIPPTAILLGLGEYIEATILRGGKATETRSMKRTSHSFSDIEKLLQEFTEVEVLPSKILIYPGCAGEDLEKIKDELMSYPWMSHLSFLHFPKIEPLPENAQFEAVIWAAASEINPNVSLKRSFTVKKPAVKVLPTLKRAHSDDFGFVKGDIKAEVQSAKLKVQNEEGLEEDNLVSPEVPEMEMTSKSALSLENVASKVKLPKLPRYGVKLGKWIFAPLALAIIFLAFLFLFKADVTIYVEPKIFEQTTEIIADPGASAISEEKKIIPGKLIETTVAGSGKEVTSGTKQIGDPAKGKVVIYNLTSGKVSLSQGTSLSSSSGLKFTLDASVQIASQSSSVGADFTTVTKPGKTDPMGLTAQAIGPESNLSASTELTVANYQKSQVIGRVEEALSGGTSKNVTVVTSDDQKKLKAKVVDELKGKAVEDLQGKITDGRKIVKEALEAVDGKYTFSKDVDDQAKDFTLDASVRFRGTSYLDSDLRTLVSKLITVDVPENFEMNLQDAETQADIAKTGKDGKLTFNAKFRAKLLPKFNTSEIKKQITGKSKNDAVAKIKDSEGVVSVEIKTFPGLPSQIVRLPILPQNITINITPK